MSQAAEVAMRIALGVLNYILDRQSPADRCAICRHVQRVMGEEAARIEAQEFHRRQRESPDR